MKFNEEWNAIVSSGITISESIIAEVNNLLFTDDPSLENVAKTDICIILGSTNCSYRVARSLEVFGENKNVVFLACGGNFASSGTTEARLIADVLSEHGVTKNRILLEEHSTNTRENLLGAKQLLDAHFSSANGLEVAVVSAAFHRRRVMSVLPQSLEHSIFINAYGPNTRPDNWYLNEIGRKVIFAELLSISDRQPMVFS